MIGGIFVHGDSLRNHIVAIIYPDPVEVKKFCQQHSLEGSSLETATHAERIKDPEVIYNIENELAKIAKEHNFNSLEKIKGNFELVAEEFEPGVILTPTMKLKRKVAREYFVLNI